MAGICKAEVYLSSGSYLRCDRPEGHARNHRDDRLLRDGKNVVDVWWHEDGIRPLDTEDKS